MASTTVNFLVPDVRLRIGDLDATSYRYLDEWIISSLILSIKSLERFWNNKYLIDDLYNVTRNPNIVFMFDETDGVIEKRDEYVIILMASLVMLEGSLENNAWNISSWKDAEISYSNLESGRLRNDTVKRLRDELYSYLKPPQKRLAWAKGQALPGYKDNAYEVNKAY